MTLLALALTILPPALQLRAEAIDPNPFSGISSIKTIFSHEQHTREAGITECSTCHHFYALGEKLPGVSSAGRACMDCHGAEGTSPRRKYAYHALCINCHLEEPAAPVTCDSCHPGRQMLKVTEDAFRNKQRPPAVFDHEAHVRETGRDRCSACHHLYRKTPTLTYAIPGQECSDCHLLDMEHESVPALQESYHQMCIDCHEQGGNAPLACGECHVRE
jgi:hypothetical protein